MHDEIPAKLLLVGDGPERQNMEQLCRDLNLMDDVRFLGKLDPVEELLAVSDLFLMPSETESFGLAALEAMACHVPVISTNTGGIPEIVVNGQTGFMSNVGDIDSMDGNALMLLTNENMLSQFKNNAAEHARQFDLVKVLPKYEAYYERVLQAQAA